MEVPTNFSKFIGNWSGNYTLYLGLEPDSILKSETTALVDFTAKGRFLKIEYDWFHNERPHEGLILLGKDKDSQKFIAFWIDSFHLSDKYLVSEGDFDTQGNISLKGSYSVPGYPDWSWRTVFDFSDEKSLKIIMYNISPEGEEELAVEAVYKN